MKRGIADVISKRPLRRLDFPVSVSGKLSPKRREPRRSGDPAANIPGRRGRCRSRRGRRSYIGRQNQGSRPACRSGHPAANIPERRGGVFRGGVAAPTVGCIHSLYVGGCVIARIPRVSVLATVLSEHRTPNTEHGTRKTCPSSASWLQHINPRRIRQAGRPIRLPGRHCPRAVFREPGVPFRPPGALFR